MSQLHVAVIGGGIIGLAVAHRLQQSGARVTVIDRNSDADKASLGNAGAIAVAEVSPITASSTWWKVLGWMLDPLGPLAVRPGHALKLLPWLARFAKSGSSEEVLRISLALSALNSRAYEDLIPVLQDIGMAGALHRTGALSLYETDSGFRGDAADWELKRSRGVVVEELSGNQAREMEPALGPRVNRAMFTPQWSHVSDPRLVLEALRRTLLDRGLTLRTGEASQIRVAGGGLVVDLEGGGSVLADKAVVAAGAWSGLLARRLGERVLLESERGYNSTIAQPGVVIGRQLIFAERKFVATPLSCGLRIGGAAEFAGLNATPNYKRSDVLVSLARLFLPGLRSDTAVPWAGHRPATPDSLPVIGPSGRIANVYYAFGHGHLGLTQAATTARVLCDEMLGRGAVVDLGPFSIGRFS